MRRGKPISLTAGPRPARPSHTPRQPRRPVADRSRAGDTPSAPTPPAPGGSATRLPTTPPAPAKPTGHGPVSSRGHPLRSHPSRSRRVRDPPPRHTPRASQADRSRTGLDPSHPRSWRVRDPPAQQGNSSRANSMVSYPSSRISNPPSHPRSAAFSDNTSAPYDRYTYVTLGQRGGQQ